MRRLHWIALRVLAWQPRPYVGWCKDGPLSWWYYRLHPGSEGMFDQTRLKRAVEVLATAVRSSLIRRCARRD